MKHYNFIICILLSSLGCISCIIPIEEDENNHYTISLYNNSNRTLYVTDTYHPYTANLDTTGYFKILDWAGDPETFKVKPFGISSKWAFNYEPYDGSYEMRFRDDKNFRFDLHIFDADKVDGQNRNLLLVTYRLKLEDLQRCHWVLSYPPHEGMRNIKMWPEFQQIYKPQD